MKKLGLFIFMFLFGIIINITEIKANIRGIDENTRFLFDYDADNKMLNICGIISEDELENHLQNYPEMIYDMEPYLNEAEILRVYYFTDYDTGLAYVFPKGIFSNLINLKELIWESSNIPEECFMDCINLQTVHIIQSNLNFDELYDENELYNTNCKIIGKRAFANCANLTMDASTDNNWILFPHEIHDEAFIGCNKIKECLINRKSYIGKNIFNGNEDINIIISSKSIELLENKKLIIDNEAFSGVKHVYFTNRSIIEAQKIDPLQFSNYPWGSKQLCEVNNENWKYNTTNAYRYKLCVYRNPIDNNISAYCCGHVNKQYNINIESISNHINNIYINNNLVEDTSNNYFDENTNITINCEPIEGYHINSIICKSYDNSNTIENGSNSITLNNLNMTYNITILDSPNTNTPYKINWYIQNNDGTYPNIPNEIEVRYGTTDTTVTISKPEFEIDPIYSVIEEKEIYISNDGKASINMYLSSSERKYTVNHYVMNIDGTYSATPDKTETFTGTTESELTNLSSYKKTSLEIANGISYDRCEINGKSITSAIIKNDGSTTLNLYYDRILYKILLNKGNGIENLPESIEYLYGQDVILPNIICKNGYEFSNWSGDINSSIINYKFSMPSNNISIIANAKPINYKITYTLNGGGFNSNYFTTYNIEDSDFTLINPTRFGYEFLGWTSEDSNDTNTQIIIIKGSTGDKNFIANWNPIQYKLVYELDGGQFTSTPITTYSVESETFTVEQPTKAHYNFVGWKVSDESDTVNVKNVSFMLDTVTVEKCSKLSVQSESVSNEKDSLKPSVVDNKLTINKGTTGNYKFTALWSLKDITVEGITNANYTGKPITFDNIVVKTTSGIIPANCYKVSYSNNTDIGTASINIELYNGYEGNITKLFNIYMETGYSFNDNNICYQVDDNNGEKTLTVTGATNKDISNVTIPDTITIGGVIYKVTVIKEGAFEGYSNLETIKLGDNIIKIEENAFKDCTKLSTIESKIEIPTSSITGCTLLNKNNNDNTDKDDTTSKTDDNKTDDKTDNKPSDSSKDDSTNKPNEISQFIVKSLKYKVNGKNTVSIIGCANKNITSINIPKTVKYNGITYKITEIKDKAFKGMKKLKKVTIGNNVQIIGKSSFEKCYKLSKVTIGSKVSTIKTKAFYKCSKLKNITIKSAKIKKIDSKAFLGINKKAKIKVPKSKIKTYKKLFKSKVGYKKTMKITK